MMKKLIQISLALVLCISLALPVWAAGDVQLSVRADRTTVEAGETFSVLVEIQDNPGFESLQVNVLYDTDLLTCSEIKAEDIFQQEGVIFAGNENADGKSSFAGINVNPIKGDGALVELTFRAMRSGSADIALEVVRMSSSGRQLPASVGTEHIKVTASPNAEEESSSAMSDVVFSDVPDGHWAYPYIQSVVKQGLFTGISNTQFGPDLPVTRAMCVTVLYGHAGAPTVSPADFSDVPASTWYARSVAWANEQGIASGIGDNKFGPELSITREQLALILYQYAKGTSPGTEAFVRMFYPDGKDISDWALTAMSWAVNEGLISGKTGNLLAPKATATRAEVAVVMQNFVNMIQ